MIKLSGLLTIRTINGRNGPFNVGRLVTEIGEFTVKDSTIEEYEEGRYEGDFGIAGIHPAHYLAGGRLIIEVRAKLATIALAGIDALAPEDQQTDTEPDPLDEPAPETASKQSQQPAASTAGAGDPEQGEDLAALFGELHPLGAKVKLDPTVDRPLFRRQTEALKRLGYRFQPVGQVWVNAEAPAPAAHTQTTEADASAEA